MKFCVVRAVSAYRVATSSLYSSTYVALLYCAVSSSTPVYSSYLRITTLINTVSVATFPARSSTEYSYVYCAGGITPEPCCSMLK